MRITNNMLISRYLTDYNNNMGRLAKYYEQMQSNRRMPRISDDPVGLITSLQSRNKLSRLETYTESLETAKSWLVQGEEALKDINSVLVSAYESVIDASNDSKTPSDRKNAAQYIMQLRDHLMETANGSLGGKFLFGGYNTTQKPFTVEVDDTDPNNPVRTLLYNGLDIVNEANDAATETALDAESEQHLEFWVGYQVKSDVTLTGVDLMGRGSENAYNILDELFTIMDSGTSKAEDLEPFISRLQTAQGETLAKMADYGGRYNRTKMVLDRYEADNINYRDLMSSVEDCDQAEVIMLYKMADSVYKASLSSGARIIQPSLMDYLR